LLAPLAVAGIVLNWVPYRLCGLLARVTDERDVTATYKLLGGFVLFPLFWAAEAGFAARFGGWRAGTAAVLAAPGLALAALAFDETRAGLLSETRAFLLLRGGARGLVARRAALHAEIVALVDEHARGAGAA
ncbi:MAG: hypothetical protein AAB368_02705, partial [bacterium]